MTCKPFVASLNPVQVCFVESLSPRYGGRRVGVATERLATEYYRRFRGSLNPVPPCAHVMSATVELFDSHSTSPTTWHVYDLVPDEAGTMVTVSTSIAYVRVDEVRAVIVTEQGTPS